MLNKKQNLNIALNLNLRNLNLLLLEKSKILYRKKFKGLFAFVFFILKEVNNIIKILILFTPHLF